MIISISKFPPNFYHVFPLMEFRPGLPHPNRHRDGDQLLPFFFIARVMMSPLQHLLVLAGVMDFTYEAPETEIPERPHSDPSSIMTQVGQSRTQTTWAVV